MRYWRSSVSSRSVSRIAIAAAITVAAAVVYAFDPVAAGFFPHCVFHELSGLQCPGCGGTRAMHALLHGDVAAAIRFNAFLVFGGPVFAAGAATNQLRRPWAGWAIVGALIAWGVLRNLV